MQPNFLLYCSDAVNKEKSQGSLFRSVLKCIPYLIEEVGRGEKITDFIPQHGISIDPGVREEAAQVLNRFTRFLPHRRFAVLRGMANFVRNLSDEFPLLIQKSLGCLLVLMRLWRECLADERSLNDDLRSHMRPKISFFHQLGDPSEFHSLEMDALGLVFLSSVDVQIRHTALELLRCVRALSNDLRGLSVNGSDSKISYGTEPMFIIDVLEENGVKIHCLFLFIMTLCGQLFKIHEIFRMISSNAATGTQAVLMTFDASWMSFHLMSHFNPFSRAKIRADGLAVSASLLNMLVNSALTLSMKQGIYAHNYCILSVVALV